MIKQKKSIIDKPKIIYNNNTLLEYSLNHQQRLSEGKIKKDSTIKPESKLHSGK